MNNDMPAERKEGQDVSSSCGGISDLACYAAGYPERRYVLDEFCSLRKRIDLGVFTSGIRLGILLLLLKLDSACACEMQYAPEEQRQSLISHHIRELRKKGWLVSSKWKKWTFYNIKDDMKPPLVSLLTSIGS